MIISLPTVVAAEALTCYEVAVGPPWASPSPPVMRGGWCKQHLSNPLPV